MGLSFAHRHWLVSALFVVLLAAPLAAQDQTEGKPPASSAPVALTYDVLAKGGTLAYDVSTWNENRRLNDDALVSLERARGRLEFQRIERGERPESQDAAPVRCRITVRTWETEQGGGKPVLTSLASEAPFEFVGKLGGGGRFEVADPADLDKRLNALANGRAYARVLRAMYLAFLEPPPANNLPDHVGASQWHFILPFGSGQELSCESYPLGSGLVLTATDGQPWGSLIHERLAATFGEGRIQSAEFRSWARGRAVVIQLRESGVSPAATSAPSGPATPVPAK